MMPATICTGSGRGALTSAAFAYSSAPPQAHDPPPPSNPLLHTHTNTLQHQTIMAHAKVVTTTAHARERQS